MDIWKEVDFRGYKLLVSYTGQVHLPKKETTYTYTRLGRPTTKVAVFKERMLKPSITSMGYLEVCFVHKRKTYKALVHRLVAMAFVDGYEPDLVVNHKDGNKLNNSPDNLEWVSKSQNSRHAWANNLIPLVGENNPGAKLTIKRVSYIKKLISMGVAPHTIAVIADVSDSLIYKIRDGERWAVVKADEAA